MIIFKNTFIIETVNFELVSCKSMQLSLKLILILSKYFSENKTLAHTLF